MKILAIDSSGLVASVAVVSDDILIGEYTIHNKKTHSQTILPMISDMLSMAEVDKHDLDAIAVSRGPGSFTGLRIGASTAKGLALALDIPIVSVSSIEGLAYNLAGTEAIVCPIMDARRLQVYYGIYDVSGDTPVAYCDEAADDIQVVIDKISELYDRFKNRVIFLGDGVPVFKDRLMEAMGDRIAFAPDTVRYQRASSVAVLGGIYYREGRYMPVSEFAPIYLRKSQAERERELKD